ncbi:MAG: DUF2914 domain-containing protein [Gammaproteobacteria bacterium]|nr:DUF2914 domain-containing protein [Gammaproteobacteria bacterium]
MKPSKTFTIIIVILSLVVGAELWNRRSGGGFLATANLVQGLSVATEAKFVLTEYWASEGTFPCKPDDLYYPLITGTASSVLAAVQLTDCGQVTLVYNDESGLAGRRLVLQAEESQGDRGFELAWDCWTPDFPDIADQVPQCRYEERQLAAVIVEQPAAEVDEEDVTAAPAAADACAIKAAIYRPVFTDGVENRAPWNRLLSYGPNRDEMTFFAEVIGAGGRDISHQWFYNDIALGDFEFDVESDRWPTWSTQRLTGLAAGTLRVEVHDDDCLIGRATITSGSGEEATATVASGWMRPKVALETTLAKPDFDYANKVKNPGFVNAVNDDGDTLLLAAIRRYDTAEAMTLIDRVVPAEDPPPTMRSAEANAYLQRHYRRADPFLRDADGVSPIQLAHDLGQDKIVEALMKSAITIHRDSTRKRTRVTNFSDNLIDTLMANDGGFTRFDNGDTPLHRAVRTNNERAVLTMLRLPGWHDQTDAFRPAVDIYAYDTDGRQALTLARESGFYAIERFLELAMTRKSPGWAVSRAAFTTQLKRGEPADCRKVAFEDEHRLYFWAEITGMKGRRIAHEWLLDRQVMHRTEFDVDRSRWSAASHRDFSPTELGAWDVRVVTDNGEVLRTERLHFRELTDYNRKNRDRMLGVCNIGSQAFYALVKAGAPATELDYLIDQGMELKLNGDMAKKLVSQAIVDGNIRLVGWFLERGLDINAYVDGAATPLLLAAKNGRSAMALYLITQGADLQFKRYRDGHSALHLSIIAGNAELTRVLLEQGADPNAPNDRGFTPLHSAISRCDQAATAVLLEYGADLDRANKAGETPRDRVGQCNTEFQGQFT